MTCHEFESIASDLLDGVLPSPQREAAERHLATCPSCRALADDLTHLVAASRSLGDITPPARVWTAVAADIRPAAGRASWRDWLTAAASVALMATSLAWVGSRLTGRETPALPIAAPSPAFESAAATYEAVIDALEPIVAPAGAPVLSEPALTAVQEGLESLDRRIDDARGALDASPDDEWSQDTLLTLLDSKVALLEHAVALLDDGAPDEEFLP